MCEVELGVTLFDKLGLGKVADKANKVGTAAGLLSEAFVYTGKSCSVVKTFGPNSIDIFGAGEPLCALCSLRAC